MLAGKLLLVNLLLGSESSQLQDLGVLGLVGSLPWFVGSLFVFVSVVY